MYSGAFLRDRIWHMDCCVDGGGGSDGRDERCQRTEEGARMLPTTLNGSRYSAHEISQAESSHPGRLSRLLIKLLPLWYGGYSLQTPRRSIDRELQEREPMELL